MELVLTLESCTGFGKITFLFPNLKLKNIVYKKFVTSFLKGENVPNCFHMVVDFSKYFDMLFFNNSANEVLRAF